VASTTVELVLPDTRAGRGLTRRLILAIALLGVALAGVYAAYFSGAPGEESQFLILRSLPTSVHFQLRVCAHTRGYPELCALHMAWLDGYSRALNPLVIWKHLSFTGDATLPAVACEMTAMIPA
ncbi:MAG: hypothetical protein AAB425_07690, partial [Bdellovibrionota bacterium]